MADPSGNTVNLAWTPQVLNAGTTVTWTHVGLGTGNYSTTLHVYGFTITGNGSPGTASFSANGFAQDAACPSTVLDISGSVAGPVSSQPAVASASAPILGGAALIVLGGGVLCLGVYVSLRRKA